MASKRRPMRTGPTVQPASKTMNFRPGGAETPKADSRGTRPTSTPTSIREVLIMMILHVCKKSIFFDINLKVALYLGSLFLISLIGDFVPFPKTYFSRSDNLFNVYFVKMGWAWTLLLSVPYLFLTSFTLCCGNMQKFLRHHLPRILIATVFWFVWTKLFNIIETNYGRCTIRTFETKYSCLKAGHFWKGFDISGHAFILIYSSLVLIEEARPIIKWESIKEHIRNEMHNRNIHEQSNTNPLRNLTDKEIKELNFLYDRFTPAIRTLFIGMTALQLLWDIMLVCTMLYYHKMIEKVLSGIFAILTWFFTYRAWYPSQQLLPDPAGTGNFIYQTPNKIFENITLKRKQSLTTPSSNKTSIPQVPKFMGMPLYQNIRTQAASQFAAANIDQTTNTDSS